MDFSIVKAKAKDFFAEATFVSHIENEQDYENALELMDELVEQYDDYLPLIELLSSSIEKWEEKSDYFSVFNSAIEDLDTGVAALKTIMAHHHLKADDLKCEIGSKSLVSMILNGSRKLTLEHIQALSSRFKVPTSVFIPQETSTPN